MAAASAYADGLAASAVATANAYTVSTAVETIAAAEAAAVATATCGTGHDTNGIVYSDDLEVTWETAFTGP